MIELLDAEIKAQLDGSGGPSANPKQRIGGGNAKSDKVRRLPAGRQIRRWFLLCAGIFLLFITLFAVPASGVYGVYNRVIDLPSKIQRLQEAVETRDIALAEAALGDLEAGITDLEYAYGRLAYLRLVPSINQYHRDGVHILTAGRLAVDAGKDIVEAIKPYATALGLKGASGTVLNTGQQLTRIIKTLPEFASSLNEVWGKLFLIGRELDAVDLNRYPQEFGGKLRFWREATWTFFDDLKTVFNSGETVLKLVPRLLGSPKRRSYLILFQNDGEIRAAGGYITGFMIVTVKDGTVLGSEFHTGAYFHGIYPQELGEPPAPIRRYLGLSLWRFHDGNYSPDFPASAKTLLRAWEESGLPKISGLIAINTEVASDLLELIGPIRVEGFDRDLAGTRWPEDCQQGGKDFTSVNLACRLEYYVEKRPKVKATEGRKAIMGDLGEAAIQKIMASSAEIWPKLIDFGFKHLAQKDLMVYALDSEEQAFLEAQGWTGDIKEYEGDYLHISDSNFIGMKTNMYMRQEVRQSLTKVGKSQWRKTVRIKYYNPQPYDGWLSANYRDFVRLYVPEGSQLVTIEGADQIWNSPDSASSQITAPGGWSELGKTVFGAFFTVWPQREHTLTFVYDLPAGAIEGGEYRLLMQKQSGTDITLVKVEIGGKMESFDLKADREITIPLAK